MRLSFDDRKKLRSTKICDDRFSGTFFRRVFHVVVVVVVSDPNC